MLKYQGVYNSIFCVLLLCVLLVLWILFDRLNWSDRFPIGAPKTVISGLNVEPDNRYHSVETIMRSWSDIGLRLDLPGMEEAWAYYGAYGDSIVVFDASETVIFRFWVGTDTLDKGVPFPSKRPVGW